MKKLIKRITARLFSIRLVDLMLLLFFVILMGYTTVHLFVHVSGETHSIDIVVRTSASAIFGYIISSQFTKNKTPSASSSESEEPTPLPEPATDSSSSENRLQIMLVSLIGIGSFLLLSLARFRPDGTPEMAAILSQLRDFASGCIGFLISCGKSNT